MPSSDATPRKLPTLPVMLTRVDVLTAPLCDTDAMMRGPRELVTDAVPAAEE